MRALMFILLAALALPAMPQTEKEIVETWQVAESGMLRAVLSEEKATLLQNATKGAQHDLEEYIQKSFADLCEERATYQDNPDALGKELDRIGAEWQRRRVAHYNTIQNALNATERAHLDALVQENIDVTVVGESVTASELLATGRTNTTKTLNRICGEAK